MFQWREKVSSCVLKEGSVTKCRGSWVVGKGRGSWVWVWVNVVGKNKPPKKDKKLKN